MRSLRFTAAVGIVVLALAACSSDTKSAVSSAATSAGGALQSAQVQGCDELVDVQATIDGARSGDADYATKAQTLADELHDLASLLNTFGADSASKEVDELSTDMQNLADASPDEVADAADTATAKVSAVQTLLSCPATATSTSASASASASA
jgi:hypothetical protein